MKPLKIIHTADWHIQDSNHDEIAKCLSALIEKSMSLFPDLVVVAGDLTESRNTRLESRSAKTIVDTVTALSMAAPVVIVSGTPSHDGSCSELLNHIPFVGPRGGRVVHVSTSPEMLCLHNGEIFSFDPDSPRKCDALISMLPTPTKQYFQTDSGIQKSDHEIAIELNDVLAGLASMSSGIDCPHIHVGHYQVSGCYISETQTLTGVDIDIHPDQLLLLGADVICLGHIHKAQEMKHKAFYSGGITRNTFGELDMKGFYVHTISDSGTVSEFIDLPARELHIIRKDFLERPINIEEIKTEITANLSGSWVKISANVWADEAREINQADIERHFLDAGSDRVLIDLIRKPRETVRSESVTSAITLRDKVHEMARLRVEAIASGVLEKAGLLETMNSDALIASIGA